MDLNFDLHPRITDGPLLHQHVDITVLGKFDGVAHEVGHNLLQTQRVADDVIRHVVLNVQRQLQPFIVRGMRQQGDHLIKRGAQQERNALQDQLPGFQLGKVEHVVDDRQQIIGRAFDGGQVVALRGVEIGFQRQAGKADHPIERGAQFVGHIGQEFRLNARRLLGALFRQVQFDVLNLHLLKGFPQIGGGLVDVVLHLLMVRRQRHGHRVDAVFQHIQLAEHKALDPTVQLPAADAVDGIDHIADRAGDVAHQAPAEDQRNADAEQHHHAGDENLFVLLQADRFEIQLQRDVAQHIARHFGIGFGGFIRGITFRDDRRAQDHHVAVADDAQTTGKRFAFRDLQVAGVELVIGGDKQAVMRIVHRDGPHDLRVATMQNADQLADRFAVLQIHAIFAGDRQRLNNAGAGVLQLTLQVVITVSDKENTEQQPYQDGWRQNQNHHASTQAVVGHAVPLWENIDIIVRCASVRLAALPL